MSVTEESGTPSSDGGGPTCESSAGNSDNGDEHGDTARGHNNRVYVDVPLAPREVRPQHTNYSPLEYIFSLLVKACGYTYGRDLNAAVVGHLTSVGCSTIADVRKSMHAIGCTSDECTVAPAYANAIGIAIPEYDAPQVKRILDTMEEFLAEFHRVKGELRRKHEPHTGTTLRRVCHFLGAHEYEPAFRDLKPKQLKPTGAAIRTIFHNLNWVYEEPCAES